MLYTDTNGVIHVGSMNAKLTQSFKSEYLLAHNQNQNFDIKITTSSSPATGQFGSIQVNNTFQGNTVTISSNSQCKFTTPITFNNQTARISKIATSTENTSDNSDIAIPTTKFVRSLIPSLIPSNYVKTTSDQLLDFTNPANSFRGTFTGNVVPSQIDDWQKGHFFQYNSTLLTYLVGNSNRVMKIISNDLMTLTCTSNLPTAIVLNADTTRITGALQFQDSSSPSITHIATSTTNTSDNTDSSIPTTKLVRSLIRPLAFNVVVTYNDSDLTEQTFTAYGTFSKSSNGWFVTSEPILTAWSNTTNSVCDIRIEVDNVSYTVDTHGSNTILGFVNFVDANNNNLYQYPIFYNSSGNWVTQYFTNNTRFVFDINQFFTEIRFTNTYIYLSS